MGKTEPTRRRPGRRKLEPIQLLVLDVDGVLTDGGIYLDAEGRELKRFHVLDGAGMKFWQRAGKQIAIISGRSSPAVVFRAGELGVTALRLNAKQKLPAYESVLAELGLSDAQTAVMGDDLPDLPLMRRSGLAIAPADAVEEVRRAADLLTRRGGGAGAVREAVEFILKGAGLWEQIMSRYREGQP